MRFAPALLMVTAVLTHAAFGADPDGQTRRLGSDVFMGGSDIRLTQPVDGDALLGGAQVLVSSRVGGDAVLAGRDVRLQGDVGDDVYAAGRDVLVAGTVGGSARIAGGRVVIAPGATIAEGGSIAGGEIDMDGSIGPYVQLAGQRIRIGGRVEGDVEASGGSLGVGPGALIEGTLTFRGPQPPEVSPDAQVRGSVRHIPGDEPGFGGWGPFSAIGFVWMLGWLIAGILLIVLAPATTQSAAQTTRRGPGWSIVFGFAVLVATPLLIGLFAATLIGIPLALLLICAWLLLIATGYLVSLMALGDAFFRRLRPTGTTSSGMRIAAFSAITILMYFVLTLPIVGPALAFVVLLAGMGGVIRMLLARRQHIPAADAPAASP